MFVCVCVWGGGGGDFYSNVTGMYAYFLSFRNYRCVFCAFSTKCNDQGSLPMQLRVWWQFKSPSGSRAEP